MDDLTWPPPLSVCLIFAPLLAALWGVMMISLKEMWIDYRKRKSNALLIFISMTPLSILISVFFVAVNVALIQNVIRLFQR